MRRVLAIAAVGTAAVAACRGDLGVGATCFVEDGGALGTCEPVGSFCGQDSTGKFVCTARNTDAGFIRPDRRELGFGLEFAEVVYVGTKPQQSVQLINEGTAGLTINNVGLSGPNASLFTYEVAGTLPIIVEGRKQAYVRVTYSPTAPSGDGGHTAQLTVDSNAGNEPSLKIGIRAKAVNPPDGG